MSAFTLTSPAFDHDEVLPDRFLTEGEAVSPPMAWTGVPDGTKELVLICEDRDADEGVVTHWVVYGILPHELDSLPEDLGNQALVQTDDFELCQGLNEFDMSGYSGPITDDPDRGAHRFFFNLHALDIELDIPPGVDRAELRVAAKGHVMATTSLVGIG